MRVLPLSVLALVAATVLPGCGSDQAAASGRVQVEAAFYPLAWVAERVGGGHVAVDGLTAAGAEPHDLELTPKQVAAVIDADLVVYLSGFQPSVDAALDERDGPVVDADRAVRDEIPGDHHVWLDPANVAAIGDDVAAALARVDPEHRADYRQGAARLRRDLEALDRDYRRALQGCAHRDLVTTHAAFAYLARGYGLRQVSVTGRDPEAEPSPRDLARLADHVRRRKVRTIYVEPLGEQDTTRTVAEEAGARTAVLDPVEGIDDESAGRNYLEVMRSNLATLVEGQPC